MFWFGVIFKNIIYMFGHIIMVKTIPKLDFNNLTSNKNFHNILLNSIKRRFDHYIDNKCVHDGHRAVSTKSPKLF